jgi:hypothetical protein
MKEILKLTAERRGEPSAPEVDPFWNRDFGWGMVDAYEAVSMAVYLRDAGLTGAVDVTTQVHVSNASLNASTGLFEIRGLAWGQAGTVVSVEARVDEGAWMQAAYEVVEGGLAAFERFEWVVALDPAAFAEGNRTVEIRGLNDQAVASLPVFVSFLGGGENGDETGGWSSETLLLVGVGLLIVLVVVFAIGGRIDPPLPLHSPEVQTGSQEAVDAELMGAGDALSSSPTKT